MKKITYYIRQVILTSILGLILFLLNFSTAFALENKGTTIKRNADGCTVDIIIQIAVDGTATDSSNVKNGLDTELGGLNLFIPCTFPTIGCCPIKFTIIVDRKSNIPAGDLSKYHQIKMVTPGPNTYSWVSDLGGNGTTRTGEWRNNASSRVFVHETLHLLGLPDQYCGRKRLANGPGGAIQVERDCDPVTACCVPDTIAGARCTPPCPGHETDIMATTAAGTVVTAGNISDVLDLAGLNTCPDPPCCIHLFFIPSTPYPSIKSAVIHLNSSGVPTGGIAFYVAPNYIETITSPILLTATGTAGNPIIFQKDPGTTGDNPKIIAYSGGTGTPGTASQDGIWNFVGSDYVTIDGIDLIDPNTTNPETMEYGYGYFKASPEDGCQHNTIQNCNITLSRNNNASGTTPAFDGSRAINVVNSTIGAQTTSLTPTSASGSNSFNKFYSNTIQNCNVGIGLNGYAASTPFTLGDTGNDIGGNEPAKGNTILNYGGGGTSSPAAGIRVNNQWGVNISYNLINNNNGSGVNHGTTLRGIFAQAGTSASATISYNNVTIKGGAASNSIYGIDNGIGSTAASNTVNINNNIITGSYSTATTGAFYAIQNTASAANVNITFNNISGITLPGTGILAGVYSNAAAGSLSINHNNIGTLNKTGTGIIYAMYVSSNPTVTAQFNAIENLSCTSVTGTVNIYGYYTVGTSAVENISDNIIRNFSGSGATSNFYGIYINSGIGNKAFQRNIIHGFGISGAGTLYGINMNYGSTDVVSDNEVYDFNANGATSGNIYGIRVASGTTNSVYNNKIHSLNNAGGTGGAIYGLYISTGTTNHVYRNLVANLSSGSSNPTVYGAYLLSGTTNNLYNNLIGDLRTPLASAAMPLAGIYISGGTYANIYHNTVYLNTSSTGTLFGSAAIYASTTPIVDLQNNIFVNASVPNGATGFTTVYRRSGTSLDNYSGNSNNNYFSSFWLGSPNRYIFYDGTTGDVNLAAFQARVAPRDNVSVTENPPGPAFLSTNFNDPLFLHIDPMISSFIESGGKTVASVTIDYDGNIRQGYPGYPAQVNGGGSAPDIGGDEYDGIPHYTCTTPDPGNTIASHNDICFGESVTLTLENFTPGTGVTYQWYSSLNGTDYEEIPDADDPVHIATPYSDDIFYKCKVECHENNSSEFSDPMQISFWKRILSVFSDSRCGIGTVNLEATGTGETISWFNEETGGSPVGSGSPWTTPEISTTTTYWVSSGSEKVVNASIGTGTVNQNTTTTYPAPYGNYFENSKHHILILASELASAGLSEGMLNSLGFDVANVGTSGVHKSFTISLANTALTALTGTFETAGFVPVYGPVDYQPVTGLNVHPFTAEFDWDGESNIIVEICFTNDASNSGNFYTQNAIMNRTPTSFISVAYKNADNIAQCPLLTGATTSAIRPNMVLNGTGLCYSARVPVTAEVIPPPELTLSALPPTICQGQSCILMAESPDPDYEFVWGPGDMHGPVQIVTPNAFIIYHCDATNSFTGCVNRKEISVNVNLTPSEVFIMPPAPVIEPGEIQMLTPSGGILPGIILHSENFNGSSKSWTTVNNSTGGTPANASWALTPDGFVYKTVAFHSNDNSQFYMSNSDAQGTGGTTDTELISPSLNTMGYETLELTFWHYFRYLDTDSQAFVEVSTNGGSNWESTPLLAFTSNQGSASGFVQATANLGAYVNYPDLKIRFRYHDSYGWYWCIDNVLLSGNGSVPITWTPHDYLYNDPECEDPYTGGTGNLPFIVYAQPPSTITYTATATSPLGCQRSADVLVTVLSIDKTLNLSSVFLEGLYNGSNTMRRANGEGYIPQWPEGVADHIKVELHNYPDYSLVEFGAEDIELSTDGMASLVTPASKSGFYYVTIKHRNSIEVTSAIPVDFSGAVIEYAFDFESKAYGNNLGLSLDGVPLIYAGDVTRDGLVDGSDMNNIGNMNDIFATGYLVEDVNGDGLVDGSDMNMTGNNNDIFVAAELP